MKALLLPGQGSQTVEWDRIHKNSDIVKEPFSDADVLKYS